jgi:ACS family tartrate transporter-like MFS transporter
LTAALRIEDRAFAKTARRLIPFMVGLYLVSFLDRVNVGFAALTMNADLGFTPAIFGLGAGIFFLGYVLLEVPSNIALERIGGRLWIFRIMITWGLASAAMAFVRGATSFYALRFLLGAAEAGFFPGMILYLTYWFPSAMRARFVASFMVAVPLASVIGAPVSGVILGLDGALGLKGWQWLFLAEGLPACLFAFAVLFLLPDGPKQASWLSEEEKSAVARALAARGGTDSRRALRALRPALRDARVWRLGLVYLGVVVSLYGIGFWLPQIVEAMGFDNREVGLVVALPYLASACAMVWWGRLSDRRGDRVVHVALPALLGACGFFAAAVASADFPILVLVMLGVGAVGVYAALAPFWALPSLFLRGTAAAGGIAMINAIGNIGGFLGPYLVGWIRETMGGYAAAMAVLGLSLVLAAAIVLGLDRSLAAPSDRFVLKRG